MRLLPCCDTLLLVRAPEVGEITEEAKGVLLSLVALGGDEAALGGLYEDERAECMAAWRALGELDEEARRALLSVWTVSAHGEATAGIDSLHPTWIEAALEGEPDYLLRHLRGRLPLPLQAVVEKLMTDAPAENQDVGIPAELSREIERLAFEPLARLCEGGCGPIAAWLCALEFEALQVEVIRKGARTLGHSLAGTDASIQARAMALAGQPWAAVMAEAFAETISAEQRRVARMHASANVHASARTAAERLLHVGLAALKSELAEEGAASMLRVAGRLPAELGRSLLSDTLVSPVGPVAAG